MSRGYARWTCGWALLLGCASGSSPQSVPAEKSAPPAAPAVAEPAAPASPDAGSPEAVATPAPPTPPARPVPEGYLAFTGACDPGPVVTIAAIGDVMVHRELQRQAYAAPEHFRVLWSGIEDLLERTDLTYGNLETPTATGLLRNGSAAPDPGMVFDNHVYSGYAKFNAHPTLTRDLAASGFDVVSTANNHSLDRESLGVDRTLEALDDAGVAHTGTRRKGSDDPWHAVTEAGGLRIAWLACTLHTNFGVDEHDQVLDCFDRADLVRDQVSVLARTPDIDAVIVTPHWGKQYAPEPSERQVDYAKRWIDAGATAILGAHPHILQPMAKLEASDGREAFVAYSLGNFVSHQRTLNRRSTVVLYLGLRRGADGVVRVVGVRYVPLHVRMVGDKKAFFVEAIDRVGGPRDARTLVTGVLGEDHLLQPDDALELAPHCDPDWAFPSAR